ncbi:RNA polymerase II subunit A C-terminal domain phosphatase [Saccharomycopsis crataegensis]|uniref:RNA polymerase II subunit A C-terminal domain phosphatase SSU72 n=1 Tax=Saccharomycopsis crataegensis TaxID=43959 RepID=A0AAV5QI33_9ASCO|nr:RNA polymerase II subunit A C-terminal domain phosphatase [Saccharomycopsis crataegensis]
MSSLKFCTVCASNQNRSMEAHKVLRDAGYTVSSYGTGSAVRLPGPSIDKPNTYAFGTAYDDIYKELEGQDSRLYTQNGVLKMLDRNRHVKQAPEKFQQNTKVFDFIITCEERCFDAVIDDLYNRGAILNRVVHVINVDIKDDTESAAVGGQAILKLVNAVAAKKKEIEKDSDDGDCLEDHLMDIMTQWQLEHPHLLLLYNVAYY